VRTAFRLAKALTVLVISVAIMGICSPLLLFLRPVPPRSTLDPDIDDGAGTDVDLPRDN
jgi:hypothetical protein